MNVKHFIIFSLEYTYQKQNQKTIAQKLLRTLQLNGFQWFNFVIIKHKNWNEFYFWQ